MFGLFKYAGCLWLRLGCKLLVTCCGYCPASNRKHIAGWKALCILWTLGSEEALLLSNSLHVKGQHPRRSLFRSSWLHPALNWPQKLPCLGSKYVKRYAILLLLIIIIADTYSVLTEPTRYSSPCIHSFNLTTPHEVGTIIINSSLQKRKLRHREVILKSQS